MSIEWGMVRKLFRHQVRSENAVPRDFVVDGKITVFAKKSLIPLVESLRGEYAKLGEGEEYAFRVELGVNEVAMRSMGPEWVEVCDAQVAFVTNRLLHQYGIVAKEVF
jgi:hypothetical protein